MIAESLKEKIKILADDHWQDKKKPLLLSGLVPKLESKELSLTEVLGGKKIKQFIEETSGVESGYKLVIDPVHRARIGVIPNNENYEYNTDIDTATNKLISQREITMSFLNIIKQLPQEEAEKVNIPTHVLAKLLCN